MASRRAGDASSPGQDRRGAQGKHGLSLVVPAKVGGAWEIEIRIGRKARRISLALEQQYQAVSGTAGVPGDGSLPISAGEIRGSELRLSLPGGVVARDPVDLVGRVAGDSLSGTVRRADREIATWSALRRP